MNTYIAKSYNIYMSNSYHFKANLGLCFVALKKNKKITKIQRAFSQSFPVKNLRDFYKNSVLIMGRACDYKFVSVSLHL